MLEADLKSEYGVRLSDLFRGKLTYRELLVYIRQLPVSSRLIKHQLGHDGEWTANEYLLAALLDGVKSTNYLISSYLNAKSKHPRVIKPPKPIDRPGDAERRAAQEKKFADKNQFNTMLAKKVTVNGVTKVVN